LKLISDQTGGTTAIAAAASHIKLTGRLILQHQLKMNGCTIPYTPIAVDLWKSRKCSKVRLFFLSHVQLDRPCGLSSCWTSPIYCSPVSKKLLIHRFQVSPIHCTKVGP